MYGVACLTLFGSMLTALAQAHDLDLACLIERRGKVLHGNGRFILYFAFFLFLVSISLSGCNQESSIAVETPPVTLTTINTSTKIISTTTLQFTPTPIPATEIPPSPTPTLKAPSPIETTTPSAYSAVELRPNLIQISSTPVWGAYWKSEDVLSVLLDSERDRTTRCRTNFEQNFDIRQSSDTFEIYTWDVSENVVCPETHPEPAYSNSIRATVSGHIVDEELSSDGTHSLLLVKVITSTLPMIGDTSLRGIDYDPTIHEGWIINHNTMELHPAFATRFNYVYKFLPENYNLLIMAGCYGDNLGSGLHIVNFENGEVLTLAESYGGLCEGSVGLSPSPNGDFLVYGGSVVSVDGKSKNQLCEDDHFARSWAWSSDSKRVYVACSESDFDLIWRYNIETGKKELLNNSISPPISFKARKLYVSPDENKLAFIWGTSDLYDQDERGLWLLGLQNEH